MTKEIRVGFLGPLGTYSHQAAKQQFDVHRSEGLRITYVPLKSIAACFSSLQEGEIDYSLVPFENSSNGQVVLTYDLFRDWFSRKSEVPKFQVVGEQFVAIHHNLISYGSDLSKITKLYSHPQAWGQCTRFLSEHGFDNNLKIERIDTSSTSKAVENLTSVSGDERLTTGAIASETASQIYGVPIQAKNVEDFCGNTTRFLVLARKEQSQQLKFDDPERDNVSEKRVVFMTFVIKENDNFGSLCNILERFKYHNLNLQSITSRPSVISPWRYIFFVEVWDGDGFSDCFSELDQLCLHNHAIGRFYRSNAFFDSL